MPKNMPKGSLITIQKRELPADYRMPQMEMAQEHYSLGLILSGDRRVITPLQHIDYHPGDVPLMPPLVYHRTIPQSDAPYKSYLVKISPECMEEFARTIDRTISETLFAEKIVRLPKDCVPAVMQLFADLLEESEKQVPYKEEIMKGELFRLLTFLWEHRESAGGGHFRSELSREILEALYRIEQDYDKSLSLEEVASEAGFSPAYFSRVFRAQLGLPFSEYLNNVRMRHVEELLTQTSKTVSEIAIETGFCNGDYLSARFRRHVGMTPSAYRKANRQA